MTYEVIKWNHHFWSTVLTVKFAAPSTFRVFFSLVATGFSVLDGRKSQEASIFHYPNQSSLARSTQGLFLPEIPGFLWPGSQKKATHQPTLGRNEVVSDTWIPNRAHAIESDTDCCSWSPALTSVPFQTFSSCRDHFHNPILSWSECLTAMT